MTSTIIKNPAGERLDLSFHPAARKDALVILGHGLTGNKDRPLLVALAEGLSARGWPCMRISFSGNGQSEGRFEDATITKEIGDLKAVLGVVPDYVRVAYAGHSMGSAVGVLTAARDLRIRALVSLAGMTRTAEFVGARVRLAHVRRGLHVGRAGAPALRDLRDRHENHRQHPAGSGRRSPSRGCSFMARRTNWCPWPDGRDAHAAAVCPKQWLEIEGGDHSFGEQDYPRVIEAMDAWFSKCFGPVKTAVAVGQPHA